MKDVVTILPTIGQNPKQTPTIGQLFPHPLPKTTRISNPLEHQDERKVPSKSFFFFFFF